MSESALQDQLNRIERRQYLILTLLVVPYLLGSGELIGLWVAMFLGTVFGFVGLLLLVFSRRRKMTRE